MRETGKGKRRLVGAQQTTAATTSPATAATVTATTAILTPSPPFPLPPLVPPPHHPHLAHACVTAPKLHRILNQRAVHLHERVVELCARSTTLHMHVHLYGCVAAHVHQHMCDSMTDLG